MKLTMRCGVTIRIERNPQILRRHAIRARHGILLRPRRRSQSDSPDRLERSSQSNRPRNCGRLGSIRAAPPRPRWSFRSVEGRRSSRSIGRGLPAIVDDTRGDVERAARLSHGGAPVGVLTGRKTGPDWRGIATVRVGLKQKPRPLLRLWKFRLLRTHFGGS